MKKIYQPLTILKAGVVWFYFFALIAHFFAPPGYSIIENNFSQLGPQGYSLTWIMQIAYIGSAGVWVYGLYLNYKNPVLHPRVAVMFAGIALLIVVAGVFKTILPGIPLEDLESASFERSVHLFAGHGSQFLGLMILIEHVKNSTSEMKKNHIIIFIALVILSVLFEFGPYVGISQRILAVTHSYWTLRYLNLYQ